MEQTFIEQCRLWCDNGEMENLIRWGKESKDIYRLMKIIDFYEHEIAVGNPRPTKATCGHFIIDRDYFKFIKQKMYSKPKW